MPKKYYILFGSIIAIGITIGILYLEVWRDAGVELPQDVTMKTASGETFSFNEMDPKVRLIEFYYIKCPDVCPLTTQRMMHLKKQFEEQDVFGDKVEFISITIDPKNDTPKAVRAYMEAYGIEDGNGWEFLTGSLEDTRKVANPFRFLFQDRGTDYLVHTSFTYLLDERNQLVEQFSMGEGFDKERVYKRIMSLVD